MRVRGQDHKEIEYANSFVIGTAVINTHTHTAPGWAPDPLMVGIRSPDGLVVGSCTSQPGVLGLIPKREEPGKTGIHRVLKYRVGPVRGLRGEGRRGWCEEWARIC